MTNSLPPSASPKLLFISKGVDSAATRYRALQFFARWRSAGYDPQHVTASGGPGSLLRMLKSAKQADVVVVLRKTFPPPLMWLLRRMAKKLLFDFDDAIFCNTDGSPSATRMSRFVAMIRHCDHVFAGNAFLAQQAARYNPAVTVIPTCVDVARYRTVAEKPRGFIELVWIGSNSTKKYLADAMPWLAAARQALPELRLKIVADFDFPDSGIPTIPVQWQEQTEAQELASSHIGIAPMRNDDWSRGKCALKLIQYMAAGLPVVSSMSGANAEVTIDGETGLLPSSPVEWVEFIGQLARDENMRQRLGEAGRRRVEIDYSIGPVFERIHSVIDGLV